MIVPSTLQLEEIMQDKQRVLILTVLACQRVRFDRLLKTMSFRYIE
jgi:DNA-binding HxlR family transcriptional regulator